MFVEQDHHQPNINESLHQISASASALAADLLDLDGQLQDDTALAIASKPELTELKTEMQQLLESDAGRSLGDPAGEVVLVAREPLYVVVPYTVCRNGIYSNLKAIRSLAIVHGIPTNIAMVYHKDEVWTEDSEDLELIPTLDMCLRLEEVAIQTLDGDGIFDKVLFPFSKHNKVVLSNMPPFSEHNTN